MAPPLPCRGGDAKLSFKEVIPKSEVSVVLIAVNEAGSAQKLVSCRVNADQFPGKHGLKWSLVTSRNLDSDFQGSFVGDLVTTSDLETVRARARDVIQSMGLTAEVTPVADGASAVLHSLDFEYHNSLCGDGCGQPQSQRVHEYQFALNIWVRETGRTGNRKVFAVHIRPVVMRRSISVGGPTWKRDPDESQTAREVSRQVLERAEGQSR